MKKNIFILFFLSLIALPSIVKADCSDSEIVRLNKIARNVQYSYEYNAQNGNFNITFNNLSKEIVLFDDTRKQSYNTNKEVTIKNIYSGKYRFHIYAKNKKCTSNLILTKYIELPFRNNYANSDKCKGIENYSYCNKWLKSSISYEIWNTKVEQYLKKINTEQKKEIKYDSIFDKMFSIIREVYVNYYHIILPSFITILCLVIYIKDKKSNLK